MSRYLLVSLILFLGSCNFQYDKKNGELENFDLSQGWFVALNNSVIGPKCLSCHAGNVAGAPRLDTYEGVLKYVVKFHPELSPLYRSITVGIPNRMPKDRPGLSATEISVFEQWIAMGAPEVRGQTGGTTTTTLVPPVLPTYDDVYSAVLAQKCGDCHDIVESNNALRIREFYKPGDPEHSKMYLMVLGNTMPRKRHPEDPNEPDPKLSDEEKQMIYFWIKGETP
jgi:hypothetical protein